MITLKRRQDKPMIELSANAPSIAIKLIDAATSYKIKGADFIDNRMWSCKKCGWWKLAIHQADSKCKRCGSECKIDFWDGIIRLLARTRGGQYMFPAGLLETVERVLKKSGYEYEVIDNDTTPTIYEGLKDLQWIGWELREHQKEAVDEAIGSLDSGYGAILHMPTGSGKTVTALKLIQMKKQRTLIIVHKLNLLKQWQKEIKSMLNYDAGVWGGGEKRERDITVAMIQSMGGMNINKFNFVLVDECVDGDTLIYTERGQIKIRDIVENEMDIKVKTHTGKLKAITHHHKIETNTKMMCISCGSSTLKCTETHKIMTVRGWVEAKDLIPTKDIIQGDTICTGPIWRTIDEVKNIDEQELVYDLEVEDDHSYVANGIVVHNCHHCPADLTYNAMMKSNAQLKVGLSATPTREDGNTLKMIAAIGDIKKVSDIKELIKRGILAKPEIRILKAPITRETGFKKYADAYRAQVVTNIDRHFLVAATAQKLVRDGYTVLITVEQIKHGKALEALIQGSKFIHGKTPKDEREKELKMFEQGKRTTIISTLLSEGSDIPSLGAIVIASGGKSQAAQMQKVGRALRTTTDKKTAIIVDIVDNVKWLRDHAQGRVMLYADTFDSTH